MKLQYTTNNGRITVGFEADTQTAMFADIARFQEVFAESKCGKCGSENLIFTTRTIDDNTYYELRCADCGAKLQYGAHKVGGGLFPKRKEDGEWLPDKGWVKWNAEKKCNE